MASLTDLAARWRKDLASWTIPEEILAAVDESPWALPAPVFVRRADEQLAAPHGPSYERVLEALPRGGTVLDVGAGAGAASLPAAAARAASVTAVDLSEEMLDELERRATPLGIPVTTVQGRWPDCARLDRTEATRTRAERDEITRALTSRLHDPSTQAKPTQAEHDHSERAEIEAVFSDSRFDVVVAKDVVYNVPDLPEFLAELTAHADRRVVIELTSRHPLTPLNPLWLKLHGLRRPERPAADDVYEIAVAMGLRPAIEHWIRPASRPYETFDELAEVTRTRLCLPSGYPTSANNWRALPGS